jgi:hypothetical protein
MGLVERLTPDKFRLDKEFEDQADLYEQASDAMAQAEEDYNLDLREHKRKLPRANQITIYKNGILIGQFDSLRKAEESTGINRGFLSKLLKSAEIKEGIKVLKINNK